MELENGFGRPGGICRPSFNLKAQIESTRRFLASFSHNLQEVMMRQLISGRIYELPSSERLIALQVGDFYWFYDACGDFSVPHRYTTGPLGRITNARHSLPTAWTVDDLVDTGGRECVADSSLWDWKAAVNLQTFY